MEIKKGEVLGIVGVNGAGKSTLLKILAGVLTSTKGRVQVHGKLNAILELGSSLKAEMTGRENIKLNLRINGVEENREALIEDIIKFADIGEHIDQPVKTYSSGMKSRLGFGMATSTNPDVLIVDEVLAVGDVLFQRKCYSKIEQLFKDGKTVIFVSHSAQSVIEFCSRAILLYDREIILDDTPKKVTDFYQKLVFSKDKRKTVDNNKKGDRGEPLEEKVIVKKRVKSNNNSFLPALKSSQSFEYKFDVKIFDVKFLNSVGERVNVLETGEFYEYTYNVKFFSAYTDVSFGMHIKTLTGLALSSSAMHSENKKINRVEKEDVFVIKWRFICNLLENTYLTNAGVFIDNGNVMSRVVDACVFKVKSKSCLKKGYIDLCQKISFEKK